MVIYFPCIVNSSCVRSNLCVVAVQVVPMFPYLCKGRYSTFYFHEKFYLESIFLAAII